MSNVQSNSKQHGALALPAAERAAPIVSAFMLGVLLIAGAGFISMPLVHNAAHDQRHAIGFPCH